MPGDTTLTAHAADLVGAAHRGLDELEGALVKRVRDHEDDVIHAWLLRREDAANATVASRRVAGGRQHIARRVGELRRAAYERGRADEALGRPGPSSARAEVVALSERLRAAHEVQERAGRASYWPALQAAMARAFLDGDGPEDVLRMPLVTEAREWLERRCA